MRTIKQYIAKDIVDEWIGVSVRVADPAFGKSFGIYLKIKDGKIFKKTKLSRSYPYRDNGKFHDALCKAVLESPMGGSFDWPGYLSNFQGAPHIIHVTWTGRLKSKTIVREPDWRPNEMIPEDHNA